MDYLTLISVPAIVSVTYAFIEILKKITKNSEKLLHFCPLIASIVGAISGVICFYFIPDIIAASNVVVAILIGAASGLAATAFSTFGVKSFILPQPFSASVPFSLRVSLRLPYSRVKT